MTQPAKTDNLLAIPAYDLGGILPDLDDMEVIPINIVENYWTPEKPGDSKRVFFKGIFEVEKQDEQTGDKYMAEVAYLIEQLMDGSHSQITNQSFKLVSTLKSLAPGTPVQVTYLGKKRTQSGNQMDDWHICPLARRQEQKPQEDDDDIFGEITE